MKIGYVKVSPTVPETSGIKIQATTWGMELSRRGHVVDYIDMWKSVDWASYDVIHLFDYNEYMVDLLRELYGINPRIVSSPIIDANYGYKSFKLASFLGCDKLRLSSKFYALKKVRDKIKCFYVRSEYEKGFLTKSYGVPENRVLLVPLSYRTGLNNNSISKKENFCLHVSLLADKRKNVERLVLAAKKYHFQLKLAGKLRDDQEKQWLNSLINDCKNVEYLGFISDEQLVQLYSTARVFALPSTYEGVGMVALEAAVMGADIVITSLGGPKEYYGSLAKVVNPYNIDEIGCAIRSFIDGESFQPDLSIRIQQNYSLESTVDLLEKSYINIAHR